MHNIANFVFQPNVDFSDFSPYRKQTLAVASNFLRFCRSSSRPPRIDLSHSIFVYESLSHIMLFSVQHI